MTDAMDYAERRMARQRARERRNREYEARLRDARQMFAILLLGGIAGWILLRLASWLYVLTLTS